MLKKRKPEPLILIVAPDKNRAGRADGPQTFKVYDEEGRPLTKGPYALHAFYTTPFKAHEALCEAHRRGIEEGYLPDRPLTVRVASEVRDAARRVEAARLPGDLDKLQKLVGEWAEKTFPEADTAAILEHCRRELLELKRAKRQGERAEESADIIMLLMHLAYREGYSLSATLRRKFVMNRDERDWGEPDASNVREHVRRPEGEEASLGAE